MIMSHVRVVSTARASPTRHDGAIVFAVDGKGNLLQRSVARASGLPELDAAALEAVAEASPFPPPPQGAPLRLRFTYGSR
jgi:protein TonB